MKAPVYFRRTTAGISLEDAPAFFHARAPSFAAAVGAESVSGVPFSRISYLWPGHPITSPNGRAQLVMQADGNLVLYDLGGQGPLWSSQTNGKGGVLATMQADGNLVVYDSGQRPIWASNTSQHPGAFAALQDDGNLVVYDSGMHSLWASGTNGFRRNFGPGTDIFTDVTNVATKAASDALNTALSGISDLLNQAPWLRDAIYAAGDEVKKFAGTPEGQTLLRAFATSLYASLAYFPATAAAGPILGPQAAAIVFALPGLAQGEPFDKAWMSEFTWRLSTAASMITSDPSIAQQFGSSLPAQLQSIGSSVQGQVSALSDKASQIASTQFPNVPLPDALKQLNITPEDLAAQLGVRPDFAAMFLNFVKKQDLFPLDQYDPLTGQKKPPAGASTTVQKLLVPVSNIPQSSFAAASRLKVPLAAQLARLPGGASTTPGTQRRLSPAPSTPPPSAPRPAPLPLVATPNGVAHAPMETVPTPESYRAAAASLGWNLAELGLSQLVGVARRGQGPAGAVG